MKNAVVEAKLKSEIDRIVENVEWARKYGESNKFYIFRAQ